MVEDLSDQQPLEFLIGGNSFLALRHSILCVASPKESHSSSRQAGVGLKGRIQSDLRTSYLIHHTIGEQTLPHEKTRQYPLAGLAHYRAVAWRLHAGRLASIASPCIRNSALLCP